MDLFAQLDNIIGAMLDKVVCPVYASVRDRMALAQRLDYWFPYGEMIHDSAPPVPDDDFALEEVPNPSKRCQRWL